MVCLTSRQKHTKTTRVTFILFYVYFNIIDVSLTDPKTSYNGNVMAGEIVTSWEGGLADRINQLAGTPCTYLYFLVPSPPVCDIYELTRVQCIPLHAVTPAVQLS